MEELSQVDLAFCVDLTNSMTPFIDAARQHAVRILDGLRATARADLRIAVVGYRDHDPRVPAVEAHDFTDDPAAVRATLDALRVGSASSNTDAAEAVVAGLVACARDLTWRAQSYRVVVLVGDGPPHACGAVGQPFPDRFPQADPAGVSLDEVAAQLEQRWTFVHALGMVPSSIPAHDAALEAAFRRLAGSTGGAYHVALDARAAMDVVEAIAKKVFGDVEFDRAVFEQLAPTQSAAAGDAAPAMGPPPAPAPAPVAVPGASPEAVEASVARLRKRGLVK